MFGNDLAGLGLALLLLVITTALRVTLQAIRHESIRCQMVALMLRGINQMGGKSRRMTEPDLGVIVRRSVNFESNFLHIAFGDQNQRA